MGIFNKKELIEIERLKEEKLNLEKLLKEIDGLSLLEIQKLKKEEENLYNDFFSKNEKLKEEIETKENLITVLSGDIDMIEFGIHIPNYVCMNSEEYSNRIKDIREKQKDMIKNKLALNYSTTWTVDGSVEKGRALNNDNMKMYLRAFNNECETIISKVKFNNYDVMVMRIKKCAESLDKINERNKISMKYDYLELKILELKLVHEYNCIKQEEKEAIKSAREEERELQKLNKEIEEARKKVKKEQTHYEKLKSDLVNRLVKNPELKEELKFKIEEVDIKLQEIDKNFEDINYRETNQKAGYVYVISNIGSFGENIYKIGMTRRLEPLDRVDELGDASVPFNFDVHAMIFSDDAPKLENALHKAFEKKKVNLMNNRKEFFNVSIDEIESVIKENHDRLVEFKKNPEAQQYKESQQIRSI